MNVACPECRSVFRVDPARVPTSSVRARCSVCGAVITIDAGEREGDEFGASTFSPSVATPPPGSPTPVEARPVTRPTPMAQPTIPSTPARPTPAMPSAIAAVTPARPTPAMAPPIVPQQPTRPTPALASLAAPALSGSGRDSDHADRRGARILTTVRDGLSNMTRPR
jgi:predicted Zn finger-like uncharacterized protein